MLTAASALSFVDRQVLTLLVESLKADLKISDSEIGLLTGFGFSVFYVILGLPLARLIDSSDRRRIIAACIALWSLMTGICGTTRTFAALLLARVGVGCGEAGINPGSASVLADYYPKRLLPAAMGVYSMGIYIGGGLALIVGGRLLHVFTLIGPVTFPLVGVVKPWQLVFFVVGLPGLLLAFAMLFVREPPRRRGSSSLEAAEKIPLREVIRYINKNRSVYGGVIIGFSLMILVGNGTTTWIPAFFMRKFHWTAMEVGNRYGPLVLLCGASGTMCGGFFAAFLRKRGLKAGNIVASLLAFVVLAPVTIAFPLVPKVTTSFVLIGLMNFLAGFPFGGGLATLQEITPNAMRAQITSIYGLSIAIFGAAMGPTVIGLLNDLLYRDPARLPESMAITAALFSPLAAMFLFLGLKGYQRLIKSTEAGAPL